MPDVPIVPGRDFIGVGVGALVFDPDGRVFMAQRGDRVRNEAGAWEFPGGMVEFGERLCDAVCREFFEEYGIEVEVTAALGFFDHILPGEGQHWVSATYLARLVTGEPAIREPLKCSAIGWFTLDRLPCPMTDISRSNLDVYLKRG